jgi:hypothetical protein
MGLLGASLAAFLSLMGCDGVTEDSPIALPTNPAFSGKITIVVSEPEGDFDMDRTYEYDLNGAVARLKSSRVAHTSRGLRCVR